jgi:hypothetical protein
MELNEEQVVRIAGFELNALHFSKVLPGSLEGARIEDPGTIIHDTEGEALFCRVPLERRGLTLGFADVAILGIFAEPLLAVDLDMR